MAHEIANDQVLRAPRNIKKTIHDIPIVIEFKKGDHKPNKRDPSDTWGFEQLADYGFIPNTTSNEEGEGIDVFLGPDLQSERVFLVALMEPDDTATFMEYKVMLGWSTHKEAEQFARNQYWDEMIGLTYEITINELKEWVEVQRPMADKLEVRLDEEEDAEEVKQEEKQIGPALMIFDETGTPSIERKNVVGDSTQYENGHNHTLLTRGRTSIDTGPEGELHDHGWSPGGRLTSSDDGHTHGLKRSRSSE